MWMPVQRRPEQGTREKTTEAMRSPNCKDEEGGCGRGKDVKVKNQWEWLLAMEERGPQFTSRV